MDTVKVKTGTKAKSRKDLANRPNGFCEAESLLDEA